MAKLTGKTAIITGGAGGIGRAAAKLFIQEGASVMLVGRDETMLAAAAREIGTDRIAFTVGDVSDEKQTAHYVDRTVSKFGGLDILFANAGTEGKIAPLEHLPVADFDRLMAVNLRGTFLGIQKSIPHLTKRGGGSIIVTSSIAGGAGVRMAGAYVASKFAVIGLAKTAALELAPAKIRVNVIHPGPIENRMMRSIEEQVAPGQAAAVKAGMIAAVPMGRYGTNEEIAPLVLFLASDDSSYCTGGSFAADGGFLAQ
jgi:NAD(P)-dependent dehydrogenase (short-subunit alcohol dehydrogenase family)